jgi:hypothetical protein
MSPERRRFPDWAERERQGDLDWIRENLHVLWPFAATAFTAQGRGAIMVDTTSQPKLGLGNPFGYLPQPEIEKLQDADVMRMVTQYDPNREVVIVLLKSGERTSTYRVQARPRELDR